MTRKLFLPVHLWTGLTLGAILIVMAVSGALLVFRSQLERRLDPQRFIVTPGSVRLSPDDLVSRAQTAHPAAELESVRYYSDPTAPFLAYFTNREFVHLNPYTGAVLGVRQRYGEGFGWIEGLHKYLQLSVPVGEPITGYTALVFLLIILTGALLWWPATRRALVAGLTLNRKLSGRPWNLNLHKTLGIYAAVILFFSAFSGAPMGLDWVKNSLYVLTGSTQTKPPMVGANYDQRFAGFDAAARSIAQVMPDAQETYIPLPKDGIVRAYVIESGAAHPNARAYVWLEGATAKVLKTSPYREASRGFRLYYWMMSLHTGVMGGPIVQVMLMLAALCVPVLAYTGTASFLRRKSGRAASQPVKNRAAFAPAELAQAGKTSA